MRVLDVSFPEPERNLALDEVLLNRAETGLSGECLRFWESPTPFVVLGVAQALSEELHEDACKKAVVPILRRCSAGGCVLQGPGCLNFTLVLDSTTRTEIRTIRSSYTYILGKLAEALGNLRTPARCSGISDLAVEGVKISGNAQRRRKRFVLHHGTLLYALDLDLIPLYLKEPSQQPDYRRSRPHSEFVANLPLSRAELTEALHYSLANSLPIQALANEELADTSTLAEQKYRDPKWVRRR